MTDFTTNGPLLSQLQSIHVVRCDEAAWRFLGLSLAGYNVLISLALAAIAALGLMRRTPA
jgi:disulfide bond formation protein DsbB